MDSWVEGFWKTAILGYLVALLTLIVTIYIFTKYIIPLFRKRALTKKESRLKSNIVTVSLSYLIISTILIFSVSWGKGFAFSYLPAICVIVLILLQLAGFPKSSTK